MFLILRLSVDFVDSPKPPSRFPDTEENEPLIPAFREEDRTFSSAKVAGCQHRLFFSQLDRLYQKVLDDLEELVDAVGLKAA